MAASPAEKEQPAARTRRDPRARRRAIVRAAADLLVEGGGGDITHRRVAERAGVPLGATTYYFASLDELREAGLQVLVDEIEEFVDYARRISAGVPREPEALARLFHDYFSDRDKMRADLALYGATIHRPELHALALRWFDAMVELLTDWTDPATARLLAAFTDGIGLHVMLRGEPVELDELTRAITALMRSAPGREEDG
ncbi:TetR family transcriptional regulator [Streptomyces sp. WMMC500]|uniref:TetR/AcrR family transcriptional regulator n=1 Tax=Streptomyces sp. WMMC500 TaxID=3015154 RepID=UPI00248C86FE|nr:TetR family transcriptional regulator [Streptomyces sp. WMMC500]WBB59682.1 TetR family transcriptional regulator [Streptomyces sp. WMMC500]